jgi:hypothetical protein
MTQVIVHLPSIHEALYSNSSTTKKTKQNHNWEKPKTTKKLEILGGTSLMLKIELGGHLPSDSNSTGL